MKTNIKNIKKAAQVAENVNTNTEKAEAPRLTKAERLAIVADKAADTLANVDKYRWHAAAALRLAVTTVDAAAIVAALRPAVELATANMPAEGVVALAAVEAEAVPSDVILACRRADGALSAAPLLRFMASASVEAESARRAGIKAAERAEARKAKKAAKKARAKAKAADAKASEAAPAKGANKGAAKGAKAKAKKANK